MVSNDIYPARIPITVVNNPCSREMVDAPAAEMPRLKATILSLRRPFGIRRPVSLS
jgi:hypothetical protein